MSNLNEITAADVEHSFGVATESGRFASLCNALLAAKAASAVVGYPALSDKPGADGSFDGEWTLSSDAGTVAGLAIPGWNVFQFKARSIAGQTRSQVISKLKSSLKGAAIELTKRLSTANKNPSHYVLFTNLQLGLATPTETAAKATLSKDRTQRTGSGFVVCRGGAWVARPLRGLRFASGGEVQGVSCGREARTAGTLGGGA